MSNFIEKYESLTDDTLEAPTKSISSSAVSSNFIQKYGQNRDQIPVVPTETKPTELAPDPLPVEELEPETYTINDLTDDKYFGTVNKYMQNRFGIDEFRDYTKQDIVDKYLVNLRGFTGGNSVRTIGEIAYLNGLKKDSPEAADAGAAYVLYQDMKGVFNKETSIMEKASGVGGFVRSTVADPTMAIGFGIGKLYSGTSSKVASKVASNMAIAAYKKQISKGVSVEAAKKVAERTWSIGFATTAKKNAANLAANQAAIQNIAPGVANKILTTAGLKELGTVVGLETAINVGLAYGYEKGLVKTGVQEDVSNINIGLAALGGMIIGGIQAGTMVARGPSKFAGTEFLATPSSTIAPPTPLNSLGQLTQTIQKIDIPYTSTLKQKAARGEELYDLDSKFFISMLLGDDSKGLTGLAQLMAQQGYRYVKRSPNDGVANFIADTIKKSDPQDAKKFIADFTQATGVKMIDLVNKTGGTTRHKLDIDSFSKIFAQKISQQGKVLNAVGQVAKKLKVKPGDGITLQEFTEALLSTGVKQKKTDTEEVFEKIALGTKESQNRVIRLLVTSPSTSALNLVGYGSSVAVNTVTDAGVASLYLGQAGLQKMFGRGQSASESLRIFRSITSSNIQRLRNLLDPNMTKDAYMSLATKDPESLRGLTDLMAGGIDAAKSLRNSGYDPNMTMTGLKTDQAIEVLQKINFVTAQDVFSKSQEFVFQMDKALRIGYNKSWSEFYKDPDVGATMLTETYQEIVEKAVYETQKATFSKSYKETSAVAEVIEEARNIPGIGLLVPFGRFFNNTVALMADGTGVSLAAKLGKINKSPRSTRETFVRTTVGLGALYSFAQTELVNRELGLAWNERVEEGAGATLDEKYNFPMSHWKALGRMTSYFLDGTEMPKEELADILGVIGPGQLTRQLDRMSEGLGVNVMKAFVGEPAEKERALNDLQVTFGSITSQVVSGSTRFLAAPNDLIGLTRGEDFKIINRKDGNKTLNDSLRYVDQFIAVATGEDMAEEKFSATTGKINSSATKQLGVREVTMTDTKKVLNIVGKPTYLADLRSKDPIADNRFNKIFHTMVESMSSDLLRSYYFREGDKKGPNSRLKLRQKMVKDLLKDAKDITLTFMERGVDDVNDITFAKMIEVGSKHSFKDIDRAIGKLSTEIPEATNFGDLNYDQLDLIQGYLKYEKDILKKY